jgi:prepilin-type N-terminal cleavage/methylation domain-containing protein
VTARRLRGFTLIEMIMVVVVLGLAAMTVTRLVSQLSSHQTDNTDLQIGTQLLQECGEWIVSNHRRDDTFFSGTLLTNGNCYGLATYGGWTAPTVNITTYTGSGCPAGATCKQAAISLDKSGAALNTMNIILVRYNPL